ncbi:MAG: hypothetical protein KAI73_03385 [Rhodospirillaceae bacterium]|nr:hypothetical protein [Rhodospirillaceae bacterium]
MDPVTPNDNPENQPENAPKPPKGRMLFIVAMLVLIMIGFYAGTFYKISVYGA